MKIYFIAAPKIHSTRGRVENGVGHVTFDK